MISSYFTQAVQMNKAGWVSSSFNDFLQPAKTACNADELCLHPKKQKTLLPTQNDELWVNKYAPRNVEELAVNKKKVAEVKEWMERSLLLCQSRRKVAPILLLTGLTGVGKSTTVRLLAVELHAEIKEWTNQPMDTYTARSQDSKYSSNFDEYESQLGKFSSFLFRANRYSSLDLSGDVGVSQRQIVLVEDIPNVVVQNATSLHDILRRYQTYSLSPLVFVISDQSGSSSDHALFPKAIQSELGINVINFNPVAPTSVMKVLLKITTSESAGTGSGTKPRMLDRDTLELFVDSNRGDIRASINALQFYCRIASPSVGSTSTRPLPVASSRGGSKARKGSSKNTRERQNVSDHAAVVSSRDGMLSLFHAVGKILHCKRDGAMDVSEEQLPSHMLSFRRNALLVNPEDVASRVCMSNEHFVSFLHQNYIDFQTNIDEVVCATGYLSDSDSLVADWSTRSVLTDYALSLATRGLLFSKRDPSTGSVGWKPLHKAQWFDVIKLSQQNCACAHDLFASYRLPPIELQTQLIPYLAMTAYQLTVSQNVFVKDIGRLSSRNLSRKARLERLDENDIMIGADDLSNVDLVPLSSVSDVVDDSCNNQLAVCEDFDDEVIIDEFDD